MVNPITIKNLPKFTGLNQESAENYYMGKERIHLLKDYVVKPFESKLKQQTGYDEENLPDKKETIDITLGDVAFSILNEKRKKKPQAGTVYNNILSYFEFLEGQHKEGKKIKDIFTIDDVAYTTLDYALQQISSFTKEEDALKQTISIDNPRDYSNIVVLQVENPIYLNESDALLYVNSFNLVKIMHKNTVKPFEDTLKQQTGYDKDNIPRETKKKLVQTGPYLFEITVIPERTVKYANIISKLVQEGKTSKTTGELLLLKDNSLDNRVLEFYKPNKNTKGDLCISITGTILRLHQLKEENTNPSLNTKIAHYPVV